MSHYLESEPEEDDESEGCESEDSEDRRFIDDDGECGSVDLGVYRELKHDSSSEEEDAGEASAEDEDDESSRAMRELHRMLGKSRERREALGRQYPLDFGLGASRSEAPELTAEEVQERLRAMSPCREKRPPPSRRKKGEMQEESHVAPRFTAGIVRAGKTPVCAPLPRPVSPAFSFVREMEEAERKKRLRDNGESMRKVLDKEREAHARRLVAAPRKTVKKVVAEPPKGNATIDRFFGRVCKFE
ncbi:hypothetical protein GUITHDRAFT_118906 [Guillardia theta CCMP2712]|uniref:Uncharacterized protein n=1 Tax=Guillardia theta (strain CCMP2712) TaxID=905079 RepID=L1IFM6_GUITC|nr:hypothetical protein GUITHDRAFT_118906 [Guillardia theta CCMP2712]EKX34867.1 hypothetical protein GUITHDRAFT_118906 [Guillardia theta CCMP2712]|eukprot:XP_005821847.1 hypothetical protein GUITHDRAFT_118906 [Guillardia theta CCMP2712]